MLRTKTPVPCPYAPFGQHVCTKDHYITPQDTRDITKRGPNRSACRPGHSRDQKRARDPRKLPTSRNHALIRCYREPRGARAVGGSLKLPGSRKRDDLRCTGGIRSTCRLNRPRHSPPSPDKHPPAHPTRHRHDPASPEAGRARPSPPTRPRRVEGAPFCKLRKTSLTRRLRTILTSRVKEWTRSCGRRAPRRVMRAGSGGDTGGEKVQVRQAGRRACSAVAHVMRYFAR